MAFSPDGAKWVPSVPQPYWKWDFLPSETSQANVALYWDWNEIAVSKAAGDPVWDGSSMITAPFPSTGDSPGTMYAALLCIDMPFGTITHPAKTRAVVRWRRRGADYATGSASSQPWIEYTLLGQSIDLGDPRNYPRDTWHTMRHPTTITLNSGSRFNMQMDFRGQGWTPNSIAYLDIDWIALYNDADF